MYQPRTLGYRKADPVKRWSLPDRVFFACGACHVLAYAFLERWGAPEMEAIWIKPDAGFTGNHIYVSNGHWAFDYHGYSSRTHFLLHTWKTSQRRWPGWNASIQALPKDVLISEQKSRTYDGLWLLEPRDFLYDALPRARTYLDRFSQPKYLSQFTPTQNT